MLIYNYKKEFLGIDEFDLQTLGFKDLAALQAEALDFADLFVKTPGYVHNFKHVHWIDFITCADSAEPPKVIILARGINYRCNIKITSIYLSENPTLKAFIVTLQNLRILTENESHAAAGDIAYKQMQINTTSITPIKRVETVQTMPVMQVSEKITPNSAAIEDMYDDLPLEIAVQEVPAPIAKPLHVAPKVIVTPPVETIEISTPKVSAKITEETPKHEHEYIFDPHVASKELGLPVDLIEEFIQDFIVQAKEFKNELYDSLHALDMTNVKILSHKLKGVAANLRVADALEVLTLINATNDFSVIQSSLDKFYRIISKLAGEAPEISIDTSNTRSDEDEFVINFKEDENALDMPLELSIDDEEAPNTIKTQFLDDDFEQHAAEVLPLDLLDINFETADDEDLSLEVSDIHKPLDTPSALEDEMLIEFLDIHKEEEIKLTPLLQTQEKISYKRETAAHEIGLDIESFQELFDDFIEEAKIKSQQIRDAILAENVALCKLKATKFKGMCENMRVIDLADELETLIQNSSVDSILNSINKIDAIILKISQKEA
jgi:HPt (histidine-containing phosphotransfer) domain-containing protein